MSVVASDLYSFLACHVQNRNKLRWLGQLDSLTSQNEPNTTLMCWRAEEDQRYDFNLTWFATRIWASETKHEVVAIGPDGRVFVSDESGEREENVQTGENGPRGYGDLSDLAEIGNRLYAVGMGRQVYRRESTGWSRQDQGILTKPTVDGVCGFNAVDGQSEDLMVAVGFGGEVWLRREGTWEQAESPTNVILNDVLALEDGSFLACGQKGTILEFKSNGWMPISHDSTEEQLWSIASFGGRIYFASRDSIFTLDNEYTLSPVDTKLPKGTTFGHLHAKDGVLLSVGAKDVVWTNDAISWANLVR